MIRILFFVQLFALSVSSFGQWHQLPGPVGGNIECMTATSNAVFIGNRGSGVHMTTDKGDNWIPKNKGLTEPFVTALTSDGSNLFAGTYNGVYMADMNASSWTFTGAALANEWIHSLFAYNNKLFAGTLTDVFVSADNGITWSAASNGLTNKIVNQFAAIGTKLFAATDGGVFVSSDEGANWVTANQGLGNASIASIAVNGNRLFVTKAGKVYSSDDFGTSWTFMSTGINGYVYSISVSANKLYTGSSGVMYISSDNGVSWQSSSVGIGLSPSIYHIVTVGNDVYAGTFYGTFVSVDEGINWQRKNKGITNYDIRSLAANSNGLYATELTSEIFSSYDGGLSWTTITNGLPLYSNKYFVFAHGNTLFTSAGLNGTYGVYRSLNNGLSWQLCNNGIGNAVVSAITSHGDTIYAGGQGVFVSTNNGDTWVNIETSLSKNYGAQAITTLGNYIVVSKGDTGTFYTNNNGATWNKVNGLNGFVYTLATHNNNMYANIGDQIYKSTDSGVNWTNSSNGLPSEEVLALYVNNQSVFAGTGAGIYKTDDNGLNWTFISPGLTNPFVTALLVNNNIMYAGTGGCSIWAASADSLVGMPNKTPGTLVELNVFPMPFHTTAQLTFDLEQEAQVELVLYNTLGQQVAMIENAHLLKGKYNYPITVPQKGNYLLKALINEKVYTKKIIQVE